MFQSRRTSIQGLIELTPDIHPDERGVFLEKYNEKQFEELGLPHFVQDNLSISTKGVLRGLHFQQEPYGQDKLVSVVAGVVFDVAVDLRKGSPTYGKWESVVLDSQKHNMFFIPKGFAHGFLVQSDEAKFFYKCSAYYSKEASMGIKYDDPTLAIPWPTEVPIIVSAQDKNLPFFATLQR